MKRTSPRGTAKHPAKRHGEAGAGAARKATPATQPKRRRPIRRSEKWVQCLDGLADRCANLETFAELLAACGNPPHGEPLPRGTVGRVGYLISDELQQLRELLHALERNGT